MKTRMIASALLMIIASAAISTNAGAAPWRGHRGEFCAPHHNERRYCGERREFHRDFDRRYRGERGGYREHEHGYHHGDR